MAKKNEVVSRAEALFQVGNYSALRKLSRSNPDNEAIGQLIKRMEPEPLVFWIGLGSVAVATALAFWLVH